MAKKKKSSLLSRFSKSQLIVAAVFVVAFGGLGVYKLAFSGATPISTSGYMDWRLNEDGKYTAPFVSSGGVVCWDTNFNAYNGSQVFNIGTKGYHAWVERLSGNTWTQVWSSASQQYNGNRDHECHSATKNATYRIKFDPYGGRAYIHGSYNVYGYSHN